jgi:hypothetical protein
MDEVLLAEIVRKFSFLCLAITLDVFSGVVVSLKAGEFKWEKLPSFMGKYVLLIVGWLLAEVAAFIPEDLYNTANLPVSYELFTSIGSVAYGFVIAGGLSSLLANLANIGLFKEKLERVGFKK